MDEKKFPCFGSHKVILVNVLDEETPYAINPDCEDCPRFRACRRAFLSGEGRYLLDKLSEPPPVTPITDEDGTTRTVALDYGLTMSLPFTSGMTWVLPGSRFKALLRILWTSQISAMGKQ